MYIGDIDLYLSNWLVARTLLVVVVIVNVFVVVNALVVVVVIIGSYSCGLQAVHSPTAPRDSQVPPRWPEGV